MTTQQNLDIFICTHKDFNPCPHSPYYKIISAYPLTEDKYSIPIIYEKNDEWLKYQKIINEFTYMTYVYENVPLKDYIGFNHYRRFFNLDDLNDRDDYDIICTNRVVEARTLYGAYQVYHKIEDLDMAMDIINKTNPEFFVDFHNAICGNTLFSCNMFLMKKELFFEYCSVIYPLLSRIAANINIEGRDNYQKRAVCFLAERITSAWIESQALNHGKRIKQVPIVFHSEWKNNNLNERGTYG